MKSRWFWAGQRKAFEYDSYGSLLCSKAMLGNSSGWLQIPCLCKPPTLFWIRVFIVFLWDGDNVIPVYEGLASDRCFQRSQPAQEPDNSTAWSHQPPGQPKELSGSCRAPVGARAAKTQLKKTQTTKEKKYGGEKKWKNPRCEGHFGAGAVKG